MRYTPVAVETFQAARINDYRRFLTQLGSEIDFKSNKWVCDKRIRSTAEAKTDATLYFSAIPGRFQEMVKYFCITYLINGAAISSTAGKLTSLSAYCRFLEEYCPKNKNFDISVHTVSEYSRWLNNGPLAESTKSLLWRDMNIFCRTMRGWNGKISLNPFSENPYSQYQRRSYKYIPENIVAQLDIAFREETIPVHIRCTYWIMRLIPSRINEVLGMKIDCLKPYDGHFCLFIPTWKQNGGYFEPVMRVIHLEDTGIAAELLELIRQQQSIAIYGQDFVEESLRGSLFTYHRFIQRSSGKIEFYKDFNVARDQHITNHFSYVCERNNIRDEQGNIFRLTSHQLRHNGITDRLAAGFTPEQIRSMTAHHGDAMIYKAYNHLDLLPKVIADKQRCVLNEPGSVVEPKILFGGRILNMEEQLEKRLLKNFRAHRVPGGICSDVTGCKSDMFFCLDCEHFVPDASQLDYFIGQTESWIRKAEQFKDFPLIQNNAEKNAQLFNAIVEKIMNLTGGKVNG